MTNIVFLCRDRFRLTEQALWTLTNNTPSDQYTLTIVDDASEDFRVKRLLGIHSIPSSRTLITIDKSAHVLARAKNLGVFWSRQTFGQGDWLYLSDNDVCFLPGWLEKLTATAEIAEDFGFKLVGGQIHPFHQPNPIGRMGARAADWTEHLVLDGPSWLMRWKTWKEVGAFSRTCAPGPCQSEDAEWCARLVAKGGRIGVIHPHVVLHTGLTQTDGKDAPGRAERERMIPPGVLAE